MQEYHTAPVAEAVGLGGVQGLLAAAAPECCPRPTSQSGDERNRDEHREGDQRDAGRHSQDAAGICEPPGRS